MLPVKELDENTGSQPIALGTEGTIRPCRVSERAGFSSLWQAVPETPVNPHWKGY